MRAGWKKTRREEPLAPYEPGAKAVVENATLDLTYQDKLMLGILSNPEYAHVDGGFVDLMTPDVPNFTAHGGEFADEAHTAQNFRSAKDSERDTRRDRTNSEEIHATQTALGGSHLSYGIYKETKWPDALHSKPIGPEATSPKVEEDTKPKGQRVGGRRFPCSTQKCSSGQIIDVFGQSVGK